MQSVKGLRDWFEKFGEAEKWWYEEECREMDWTEEFKLQ